MKTLTQIKFQSTFVNCKLQTRHPNQQPFKGMISDSFLQSSKYERAGRRREYLDLFGTAE